MRVSDLERATAFYRDTLGLKHLFTAGTMAFFDAGGVRLLLGLGQADDDGPHGTSILYYRVADIRAAHADLESARVPCLQQPQCVHTDERGVELWMGFYADSEGNSFALMQDQP